jgi:hypothetical protein
VAQGKAGSNFALLRQNGKYSNNPTRTQKNTATAQKTPNTEQTKRNPIKFYD